MTNQAPSRMYDQDVFGDSTITDVNDLLKMGFSFRDIERLFYSHVKKNEPKHSIRSSLVLQFFREFKERYHLSFFESKDIKEKEEFATYFVNEVIKGYDPGFLKNLECDFPDLGCTGMDDGTCALQINHIFYTQGNPCNRPIVATDCARQGNDPEHDDCDYSYHWVIPKSVFTASANVYTWNWYCTHAAYRVFMPENISGYKMAVLNGDGSVTYYASTFLGNLHIFALYATYFFSCEQDQWIEDTRFRFTTNIQKPPTG